MLTDTAVFPRLHTQNRLDEPLSLLAGQTAGRGRGLKSGTRYWLIRGFDSNKLIFEAKISTGQISRDKLEQLLKALAGKAGLSFEEMVAAYAKRRTRVANSLLLY